MLIHLVSPNALLMAIFFQIGSSKEESRHLISLTCDLIVEKKKTLGVETTTAFHSRENDY